MVNHICLSRAPVVTGLTLIRHVSLAMRLPHVECEDIGIMEFLLTNHTGINTMAQEMNLKYIKIPNNLSSCSFKLWL